MALMRRPSSFSIFSSTISLFFHHCVRSKTTTRRLFQFTEEIRNSSLPSVRGSVPFSIFVFLSLSLKFLHRLIALL